MSLEFGILEVLVIFRGFFSLHTGPEYNKLSAMARRREKGRKKLVKAFKLLQFWFLGIEVDKGFSEQVHISKVVPTASAHLRPLGSLPALSFPPPTQVASSSSSVFLPFRKALFFFFFK